jgi:hypothetical protein
MVYHPYEYQQRLIHTYHNYRFSISLMPRQTGKCFSINTMINIRNTLTGVEENITIGKFYDRHCSMPNLQCQNEGTTFTSVPKTSTHDHAISSAVSRSGDQNSVYNRRAIGESVRSKEPRFSNLEVRELSNSVDRKFIETYEVANVEILSDTGWQPLSHLHKTIKYDVWVIETETGLTLDGADTHILFDENFNQVFMQDLTPGDFIKTKNGNEHVRSVTKTSRVEHMFDVSVDSSDHRFYSNDILSHNSTSAAGYLLWYAMFNPDSTLLIAAHIARGSQEIMQRIRFAYENCPDHIKAGVTTYNKGSIDFENGSRIVSTTTTENTGRGMSITLLYLDEFAFVRNSIAKEFWAAISPTLSTGGKAIITSTPSSDEDQFAYIWKQANKTEDEYGNKTELGVNGFRAFKSTWDEHPERDQAYADQMRAQLGDDRFEREINCLAGSTNVTVKNKAGEIRTMSIDDLTALLNS